MAFSRASFPHQALEQTSGSDDLNNLVVNSSPQDAVYRLLLVLLSEMMYSCQELEKAKALCISLRGTVLHSGDKVGQP